MPDAYEVHDGIFIQHIVTTSAANALSRVSDPVPAGRVWTVLAAFIRVSIAETQNFWFAIQSGGYNYPITLPTNIALDPATSKFFPLVREGMEIKLFPGERLAVYRDNFTAGSTISLYLRYLDTDLDYYVELDKHKTLRRRMAAMEISNPSSFGSVGSSPTGQSARSFLRGGKSKPSL